MADIIFLEKRKRCQWCEGRTPRMAINHRGHAICTTDIPEHWKQLVKEGWRRAAIIEIQNRKYKHKEITFISPSIAYRDGHVLTEYLIHPICAANRHCDVMNGL